MVMRRELLVIPPFVHSECADVIRMCWREPSQRPLMMEVCVEGWSEKAERLRERENIGGREIEKKSVEIERTMRRCAEPFRR